jgi:hypothetical protein
MTIATQPGGGSSARPKPSGLADVIDTILDKGLVLDAYVRVSLVGIELLTIDARVVIASVDTYLRFAEAVRACQSLSAASRRTAPGTRRRAPLRPRAISSASSRTARTGTARTGTASTQGGVPAARRETEMTAQTEDRQASGGQTGVYVYGILPGDIEIEPGAAGVGDPPGEIRAIRYRDLAALVSDVDLGRPLGRAEDLFTHEELLDSSAADVPVLPLRFGAVLASDDAVADELLGPHYDEFSAALQQLDGHAEYVVKGRYVEQAVLGEVLTENPEAARLGDEIRGMDPDVTRDQRIRLGEIVVATIEARRQADTHALGDAVSGQVTASVVRPPTHELDAVYAAFLVETGKAEALREAVERLAEEWQDRIDLTLVGPLAAYDFVGGGAPTPES